MKIVPHEDSDFRQVRQQFGALAATSESETGDSKQAKREARLSKEFSAVMDKIAGLLNKTDASQVLGQALEQPMATVVLPATPSVTQKTEAKTQIKHEFDNEESASNNLQSGSDSEQSVKSLSEDAENQSQSEQPDEDTQSGTLSADQTIDTRQQPDLQAAQIKAAESVNVAVNGNKAQAATPEESISEESATSVVAEQSEVSYKTLAGTKKSVDSQSQTPEQTQVATDSSSVQQEVQDSNLSGNNNLNQDVSGAKKVTESEAEKVNALLTSAVSQPLKTIDNAINFSSFTEIVKPRLDLSFNRATIDLGIQKIGESKSTPLGNQNPLSADGRGLNLAQNTGRSEESRSSRGALVRIPSGATMEKVEAALKEAAKSKDGKTISMRLDPPNLGSIKVDVSLKDGNLHARVVAESPQVNNFLRERAHEIQAVLRKIGLNVDQVSVAIGGDHSGSQQFNSKQQGEQRRSDNDFQLGDGIPISSGQSLQTVDQGNISILNRANQAELEHWIA